MNVFKCSAGRFWLYDRAKLLPSLNIRFRDDVGDLCVGVFLLCWVPFFTLNIVSAICLRYDLFDVLAVCRTDPDLLAFFVWLGYINSFLNPVIYTIFNVEFRRAFKRLLHQPCSQTTI